MRLLLATVIPLDTVRTQRGLGSMRMSVAVIGSSWAFWPMILRGLDGYGFAELLVRRLLNVELLPQQLSASGAHPDHSPVHCARQQPKYQNAYHPRDVQRNQHSPGVEGAGVPQQEDAGHNLEADHDPDVGPHRRATSGFLVVLRHRR